MLFARLVPAWNPKDPPLYYFAVSLGTDFVYTIVGGYLCALIAEEHRRKATLWLIALGEVLGYRGPGECCGVWCRTGTASVCLFSIHSASGSIRRLRQAPGQTRSIRIRFFLSCRMCSTMP